jgi:hypothetical protein
MISKISPYTCTVYTQNNFIWIIMIVNDYQKQKILKVTVVLELAGQYSHSNDDPRF